MHRAPTDLMAGGVPTIGSILRCRLLGGLVERAVSQACPKRALRAAASLESERPLKRVALPAPSD